MDAHLNKRVRTNNAKPSVRGDPDESPNSNGCAKSGMVVGRQREDRAGRHSDHVARDRRADHRVEPDATVVTRRAIGASRAAKDTDRIAL